MIHSLTHMSKDTTIEVDERITIALTFSAILAVLTADSWFFPFILGGVCILLLKMLGLNPFVLWRRIWFPLLMAVLTGGSQVFLWGHTPFFQLDTGILQFTAYREGIERGLLLASRIFAGITLMSVLTTLNSGTRWIKALAWFRVPLMIIELMITAYNSIYNLWEDLQRLHKAQKMRLGYGSWFQGIRSTGMISATLVTRVFDRSLNLSQAMKCRGDKGALTLDYVFTTGHYDKVILILGLVLIWGFWLMLA